MKSVVWGSIALMILDLINILMVSQQYGANKVLCIFSLVLVNGLACPIIAREIIAHNKNNDDNDDDF